MDDEFRVLSVVIPAHNEERALPNCLATLIRSRGIRLHIVVVANGCDDTTTQIARASIPYVEAAGHHLEVVERTIAGKAGALDAGDLHCVPGPRLYLDADVQLESDAAALLADALQPGSGVHLAAPALRVVRPSARLCASYVRVWSALPYIHDQVVGCGVYAVSEAGRRRWGRFPPILSDDRFARLQFEESEQRVVRSTAFTIAFPERPRQLIASRARWSRGNRQLAKRYPELMDRDRARVLPGMAFVLARPDLWPDLPVFILLFLYARIASLTPPRSTAWARETSSFARRPTVTSTDPERPIHAYRYLPTRSASAARTGSASSDRQISSSGCQGLSRL